MALGLMAGMLLGSPAWADQPVVITSSSKQFIVRGRQLGHLKSPAIPNSALVLLLVMVILRVFLFCDLLLRVLLFCVIRFRM